MTLRRPVALALLLLLAFSISFLGATIGDPGGEDAPDTLEDAKTLPAPGNYEGNLSPHGDADWYKMEAVDLDLVDVPVCFEATAQKTNGQDALADVDLTFDEGRTQLVRDELNPDRNVNLGLVASSFAKAYTGLHPVSANHSYGPYELSVDVLDVDDLDGDGGTGLDAPSLDNATDPISIPSACFGGTLDLNDTEDAFAFDAAADELISLTFTNVSDLPVNATLISPDGIEYGPYDTSGTTSVYNVSVDTSGTWTLSLSGTSTDTSTSYLTGLSTTLDPEEEENGCSPYCLE